MPNRPVPAAAEGLPGFDADNFDLALHHVATLLDMIVGELCEIDRDEVQAAEKQLNNLDSLAWIARDQLEWMSARFPAASFRRTAAQEVQS